MAWEVGRPKRLIDLYSIGTEVEILLDKQWQRGHIVRHDFPAVWVQTEAGFSWFVTNGRRIRRKSATEDGEE